MKINEFIKDDKYNLNNISMIKASVYCKDGFNMSVQVGHAMYCEPRLDDAKYYFSMEIGFPSEKEPCLMNYAEDCDNPTETVYPYVPTFLIDNIIDKHGGMDTLEILKQMEY